jgi:hypothetical protein
MPKIQQRIIKSIFYLYRDRDSAEAGIGAVGTGFIVGLHAGRKNHYYGVTNKHVACKNGASIVRLNTHAGVEVFDFGPEDWEFNPEGEDIAAVPLDLDEERHEVSAISTDLFARRGDANVGVGDDVFMIGLFADHEGREKNIPMVRFGNISMLASNDAPVMVGGRRYECHVVDMHARSGFSGSPVFVYRTFGSDLTRSSGEAVQVDLSPILRQMRSADTIQRVPQRIESKLYYETMFRFLGVHFAQFSERWELKSHEGFQLEANTAQVSADQTFVSGVSGMTCVAPAWKILEVLNQPKFLEQRQHSTSP